MGPWIVLEGSLFISVYIWGRGEEFGWLGCLPMYIKFSATWGDGSCIQALSALLSCGHCAGFEVVLCVETVCHGKLLNYAYRNGPWGPSTTFRRLTTNITRALSTPASSWPASYPLCSTDPRQHINNGASTTVDKQSVRPESGLGVVAHDAPQYTSVSYLNMSTDSRPSPRFTPMVQLPT